MLDVSDPVDVASCLETAKAVNDDKQQPLLAFCAPVPGETVTVDAPAPQDTTPQQ